MAEAPGNQRRSGMVSPLYRLCLWSIFLAYVAWRKEQTGVWERDEAMHYAREIGLVQVKKRIW